MHAVGELVDFEFKAVGEFLELRARRGMERRMRVGALWVGGRGLRWGVGGREVC